MATLLQDLEEIYPMPAELKHAAGVGELLPSAKARYAAILKRSDSPAAGDAAALADLMKALNIDHSQLFADLTHLEQYRQDKRNLTTYDPAADEREEAALATLIAAHNAEVVRTVESLNVKGQEINHRNLLLRERRHNLAEIQNQISAFRAKNPELFD